MTTLDELQKRLDDFVTDREWAPFHSPKNLVMGLCSEAGELIEHFRWLSEDQSSALDDRQRREVMRELADVHIYLLLLARQLDIDLLQATAEKIEENAEKYPIDKSRGRALKYTDL